MVFTSMTLNDLEPPKIADFIVFFNFLAVAHILRVNCADVDADRHGQPANRNC